MSSIESIEPKPKTKKSKKNVSRNASLESQLKKEAAEAEAAKKKAAKLAAQRKKERENEKIRKMFVSRQDPYETPLKWWETDHVKYAINYPPVKSYLDEVMGSHIVRFTDRKYMQALATNIRKHREKQQNVRIEERKLKPPSIISRLMETSYKALIEVKKQKNYNKLKLYL
ncbi:uncharacterized protein LOC143217451 [Lasioglossum baleicum]|uniref:uncharacterized protein LOC143217451 n=1 Tax=Lasioglossum baleicum TaxID=434251 RepID=UPI003FCD5424